MDEKTKKLIKILINEQTGYGFGQTDISTAGKESNKKEQDADADNGGPGGFTSLTIDELGNLPVPYKNENCPDITSWSTAALATIELLIYYALMSSVKDVHGILSRGESYRKAYSIMKSVVDTMSNSRNVQFQEYLQKFGPELEAKIRPLMDKVKFYAKQNKGLEFYQLIRKPGAPTAFLKDLGKALLSGTAGIVKKSPWIGLALWGIYSVLEKTTEDDNILRILTGYLLVSKFIDNIIIGDYGLAGLGYNIEQKESVRCLFRNSIIGLAGAIFAKKLLSSTWKNRNVAGIKKDYFILVEKTHINSARQFEQIFTTRSAGQFEKYQKEIDYMLGSNKLSKEEANSAKQALKEIQENFLNLNSYDDIKIPKFKHSSEETKSAIEEIFESAITDCKKISNDAHIVVGELNVGKIKELREEASKSLSEIKGKIDDLDSVLKKIADDDALKTLDDILASKKGIGVIKKGAEIAKNIELLVLSGDPLAAVGLLRQLKGSINVSGILRQPPGKKLDKLDVEYVLTLFDDLRFEKQIKKVSEEVAETFFANSKISTKGVKDQVPSPPFARGPNQDITDDQVRSLFSAYIKQIVSNLRPRPQVDPETIELILSEVAKRVENLYTLPRASDYIIRAKDTLTSKFSLIMAGVVTQDIIRGFYGKDADDWEIKIPSVPVRIDAPFNITKYLRSYDGLKDYGRLLGKILGEPDKFKNLYSQTFDTNDKEVDLFIRTKAAEARNVEESDKDETIKTIMNEFSRLRADNLQELIPEEEKEEKLKEERLYMILDLVVFHSDFKERLEKFFKLSTPNRTFDNLKKAFEPNKLGLNAFRRRAIQQGKDLDKIIKYLPNSENSPESTQGDSKVDQLKEEQVIVIGDSNAADNTRILASLSKNPRRINEMSKKDIRDLVAEVLNENYSKYPYNANEPSEGEPDEDYMVEWKALVDEVCGSKVKNVDGDPKTMEDAAVEVAKLFVKDQDLFRDVLEMAGSNKSIGVEILQQLKAAREKNV